MKTYLRLEHGITEQTPVRIKHDLWRETGPGQRDMHYEVELGVVLTGRMFREHQGHVALFPAGSIWLCGIWEPHSAQVLESPLELVMFHIHPGALAALAFPEAPPFQFLQYFTSPPDIRVQGMQENAETWLGIGERMRSLSKKSDSWQNRLRSRLLLIEFLVEIATRVPVQRYHTSPSNRHEQLNRAIELVFSRQDLVTVAEAAQYAGVNRNDFSRAFQELMGISFKEFQLHHRIRCAAAELRVGRKSLKEIAVEWGFTDKSHLHRHFRRVYGCTPGEYRKEGR